MLASHEVAGGAAARTLAQLVLDKAPAENKTVSHLKLFWVTGFFLLTSQLTLTHENLNMHYVIKAKGDQWPLGLVYFAVTRNTADRRSCFMFLFKLEKLFEEKYVGKLASTDTVEALLNNSDLEKDVADLTAEAEQGDSNVTEQTKKELDQVKNIMVENVERLLERGERINLLVSKTDRMNHNAEAFRRRTVHLRRNMWWQNVKYMTFGIFACLLTLYLLLAFVCGLFFERCFARQT